MRQIYIGADHRGFILKETLKEDLRSKGYYVTDLGGKSADSGDDYTDIAIKLGEKVVLEKALGILICGSGVGVSIAANKVYGIRAALCTSVKQARLAREDDDANVLCLSGDLIDEEVAREISGVFIETVFSSEERHIRRIQKINQYETTKICQ
jgi:ribose 5-phosphate isomerase B